MDIIDRLSEVKNALRVSTNLREIIDEAIDEIVRLRDHREETSIQFDTCANAEIVLRQTLNWTEKADRWEGRRSGSKTIVAEVLK
jgi:hypothetical protein